MKVLREGGSAVDAAVAVQAVLGLVEPQSSGLGGGAFMTFYDAKTTQGDRLQRPRDRPGRRRRPTCSSARTASRCRFATAVLSGRSTGVPGAVAMLAMAQKDHGKLPWTQPVRRRRAPGRRRLHRSARAWPA